MDPKPLPNEIWQNVLRRLGFCQSKALQRVCRAWRLILTTASAQSVALDISTPIGRQILQEKDSSATALGRAFRKAVTSTTALVVFSTDQSCQHFRLPRERSPYNEWGAFFYAFGEAGRTVLDNVVITDDLRALCEFLYGVDELVLRNCRLVYTMYPNKPVGVLAVENAVVRRPLARSLFAVMDRIVSPVSLEQLEAIRLLPESHQYDIAGTTSYYEFDMRLRTHTDGIPVDLDKLSNLTKYVLVQGYFGGEQTLKRGKNNGPGSHDDDFPKESSDDVRRQPRQSARQQQPGKSCVLA